MAPITPATRSQVVAWIGEEFTAWIEANSKTVGLPTSFHFTANIL